MPAIRLDQPDPHVRTGRWYAGARTISPHDLRRHGQPVPVAVQLYPTGTADTWHARVYVDGALQAGVERGAAADRLHGLHRRHDESSRSVMPSPT